MDGIPAGTAATSWASPGRPTQGWIIGAEGFSAANAVPTLSGIVLVVAWSVWFLISAWRMKDGTTAVRRGR